MTLNAVIRCSSCNRISKKSGSKDNKCSQCLEIERLKIEKAELQVKVVRYKTKYERLKEFDAGRPRKKPRKKSIEKI